MSNSDDHLPPAAREPDVFKTIEEFKRTPTRVGCFGCMLSGWGLVLGAAASLFLIYLIWSAALER